MSIRKSSRRVGWSIYARIRTSVKKSTGSLWMSWFTVFSSRKQFQFELPVLPEQRFHFGFRSLLGADLLAPLLVFNGTFFKFILEPGRGNRGTRLHPVFPFEVLWIEQCRNVGFPRLDALRRR